MSEQEQPGKYCYEYPRPSVTVDLIVFGLSRDGLRMLLIKRKADPYAGRWAVPGGFLNLDEPIEDAARRELREETGLEHAGKVAFLGVYGDPGRDPRGRTISLAHVAAVRSPLPEVAGRDDAAEAAWLDPNDPSIRPLAFDHDRMVDHAKNWLQLGLRLGTIATAMLPRPFQGKDLSNLFRGAFGSVDPVEIDRWIETARRLGAIAATETGWTVTDESIAVAG